MRSCGYTDTKIVHCSMLAEDAIKSAIQNYNSKRSTKKTDLGGATLGKIDIEVPTAHAAAA